MANEGNPPLFVQTGVYPARRDRSHTGSLLSPGAKSDTDLNFMAPRSGVRPQKVDNFGETALRVESFGTKVRVRPGVAFVSGDSVTQGISGVYVVLSESYVEPTLPAYVPGVATNVYIGIEILDPTDQGGSSGTPGSWAIVAKSSEPTKNWLALARVTIPGTAGADTSVTDFRTYTASLGGVVPVRGGVAEVTATAADAPYGSLAFSVEENILYQRDKAGWSTLPSVARVEGGQATAGIPGRSGQLLWMSDIKTLFVYDKDENGQPNYIPIARFPSAARTGRATSWTPGPTRVMTSAFNLQVKVDGGWHSIGNEKVTSYNTDNPKPEEMGLIIYVRSTTLKSPVRVKLIADVTVYKEKVEPPPEERAIPELEVDPSNTLSIGIDITGGSVIPMDAAEPINAEGSYYSASYLEDPLRSATWQGLGGSREAYFQYYFGTGDFQIRPTFQSSSAASYFDIKNLKLEVDTL